MTRTYEEIREQVGPISLGSALPKFAWVGNEKSLKARNEWLKLQKDHIDRCGELAETIDCLTDNVWTSGYDERLRGFTPNDPNNPNKAIREDSDTRGMWVPNRRTKVGKALEKVIEAINHQLPPRNPQGVEGSVIVRGRMYYPLMNVHPDYYPVAAIGIDPLEGRPGFGGMFHIDTDLYEPIPVSWLVRLSEENSNG